MSSTTQQGSEGKPAQGGARDDGGRDRRDRKLSSQEKRTLAVLGVPTFGLALSITTVSTYLPKVATEFTGSTTIIGLIVGGEGVVALFLPLLAGSWSDQLKTRLGGRLPFLLAGTPVVALALVLMGFVGSLLALALVVLLFFLAYFTAYEPYRALYPDLVADDIEGKAQSTQALWRGAGTGLALVGGGLLLALARPVPFVVAAVVVLAAVGTFTYFMVHGRDVAQAETPERHGLRNMAASLRRLVADHPALRAFLFANALWELSLSALKTFIVLYVTVGLGRSLSTASLAIGAVAVVILVATPVSGKLADRFGRIAVLRVALVFYGIGLLVPFLTQSIPLLAAVIPFIAFGGGVIMTLPYALLIPMMPAGEHGALTGFYSLSRGLGTMLGPLLAGVAVQALKGPLSSTHGYAGMWLVCSAAILASIPLLGTVGKGVKAGAAEA